MSKPIIDPITGTTDDTVKLLLGICEGEIEGIESAKDVYFDKPPILTITAVPILRM